MVVVSPLLSLKKNSCYSVLAYKVSVEKSSDNLTEISSYVICCFSLVAFNIFCVCLIFVSLIICVLVSFSFFILSGTLCVSWT